MPLKVYHKTKAITASDSYSKDYFVLSNDAMVHQEQLTMWSLLANIYRGLQWAVASSTSGSMIIPIVLILAGGGFIYLQVQPAIKDQVLQSMDYLNQGNVALVPQSYIENRYQYVSNPGADSFQKLTEAAIREGVFKQDTQSANYKGTLYVSIPRLKINRMPITANVDSSSSDIYDKVLDRTLAHFKGTSLPTSPILGNTVIYGHSVGGSYQPKASDVISAFTFLPELQLGDEITLEMDGQKFTYLMRSSDVVKPETTSILANMNGRSTLTLFTCWPPGSRENRYVVKAILKQS